MSAEMPFPVRTSVLVFALAACKPSEASRTIHVAAAISLKESIEELAHAFESAHPQIKITIALGASGDLATQVEHGAPVDLFASAAEEPALRLVEGGRAAPSCMLASNALVLIRRSDPSLASLSWTNLGAFPAVAHLALGLSPSVPAGTYAEESLKKLGIFEALSTKIVRGANVRQVLDLVVRGEADAGIVYVSDVVGRADVFVVGEPPVEARPRILYPLVLAANATSDARDFATWLCSPQAESVLVKHGFKPATM